MLHTLIWGPGYLSLKQSDMPETAMPTCTVPREEYFKVTNLGQRQASGNKQCVNV